MLHFFLTISKHLIVGAGDRIRHQKKPLTATLKQVMAGSMEINPLVHFFLIETDSGVRYSEVGKPGDLPSVPEFLDRATAVFTEAQMKAGIAISDVVMKARPGLYDLLVNRGYPLYNMAGPALKRGVAHLRVWEDSLTQALSDHPKGTYPAWKIVAPKAAVACGRFEYDGNRLYRVMDATCEKVVGKHPRDVKFLRMFTEKIEVHSSEFVRGEDFIAGENGFTRKDDGRHILYTGIDWKLSTSAGDFSVHLCAEKGSTVVEIACSFDMPEVISNALLGTKDYEHGDPFPLWTLLWAFRVKAAIGEGLPPDIQQMIDTASFMTPRGTMTFSPGLLNVGRRQAVA